MTWKNPPKLVPTKAKSAKIIMPEDVAGQSEGSQQKALFVWAALNVSQYPQLKWLVHIPNGGTRVLREAVELKAQGVKAGFPDLMLPWASKNEFYRFDGLFIEMKAAERQNHKNGGCSDEQIAWMKWLSVENNYCWRVAYGWIEARDTLINYLEGKC